VGDGAAFRLLAAVADAGDEAVEGARRLFAALPARAEDPLAAAWGFKKHLSRQGFRDLPEAFTLPDMLARRGGNCLGLTLLVGAALVDRGVPVAVEIAVNPRDAVHDAGCEHFDLLLDEREGIDRDARLPDAADRSSRFRFAPAEHASLVVADASGAARTFEATGLAPDEVHDDPAWSPPAESRRRLSFSELAAATLSERAKALVARGDAPPRDVERLLVRSLRRWRGNREGWSLLWEHALARRPALARLAARRYRALGGDDSLWHFTLYRMGGGARHLGRARAIFREYADAHYEACVRPGLLADASPEARDEARRHFAVVAWAYAESESLDLRRFYADRRDDFVRLFGAAEYREAMATFETEP
jgi:hypothetical protein